MRDASQRRRVSRSGSVHAPFQLTVECLQSLSTHHTTGRIEQPLPDGGDRSSNVEVSVVEHGRATTGARRQLHVGGADHETQTPARIYTHAVTNGVRPH